MKRMVVLIVLDGWGLGAKSETNPIYVANPERFAYMEQNFPMTSLEASGISVGLPWGELGNSEVGHLTIGAGKVIYQYLPKITLAIRDGTFFQNENLKKAFAHARENKSAVNLVGLLTSGTVHASLDHLQALIKMAELEGVSNLRLHLFADGKDSPPRSLETLLGKIPREKLVSLTGRYYAMDRSRNWKLVERAYECLIGKINPTPDLMASIAQTYASEYSEEFLPPLLLDGERAIHDNDAVIFFNFREDSIREITEAFLLPDFDKFPVQHFNNLYVTTLTRYEERFTAPVAFDPDTVQIPLGKVISDAGLTQVRIAETYKYAHVTYFFNGYTEAPYANEYRVLIPSLSTPHPDEHPELMAAAITDRLLEAIQNQAFDFAMVNYSNPDSMGHTGNYQAALAAIQVINTEIGRVLEAALKTDTILIITSDHGNVEQMLNPITSAAETEHNMSPVPFYLINRDLQGRRFFNWPDVLHETGGVLSDVAPTILELMGIPQPPEMNGHSLLRGII